MINGNKNIKMKFLNIWNFMYLWNRNYNLKQNVRNKTVLKSGIDKKEIKYIRHKIVKTKI